MRQFLSVAFDAFSKAVGARELGLVVGLVMIGVSAGMVWLPAGIFLPGAVLLYVTIFGLKI